MPVLSILAHQELYALFSAPFAKLWDMGGAAGEQTVAALNVFQGHHVCSFNLSRLKITYISSKKLHLPTYGAEEAPAE